MTNQAGKSTLCVFECVDKSLVESELREQNVCADFANEGKPPSINRLRGVRTRLNLDAARSMLIRWCKFNFVGGMGIIVQFGALFSLKSRLHLEYLPATAIAVEIAVLHNFFWHERFTWADRIGADNLFGEADSRGRNNSDGWRGPLERLARFHAANGAVSIVGNLALMKVMVGEGRMNYLAANAIAIALCSLANFLLSEEWVFAE